MKDLVLSEALEQLIDHRGKTPLKLGSAFVETGVPVASAVLVKNGRLDLKEARCVDRATFERWMPVPTRHGDVILTSEAPLGRVARVTSDDSLVLGQRLYGLRGRRGILDSGYLFYALQTERVQADLIGRSTGTTVFGIRQSELRQVLIPAPGFSEQRAIAELLAALDDKIAANDTLAKRSRHLASTTFLRAAMGGRKFHIVDISSMLTRGVTPKYTEEVGMTVLNQKCVREQSITLAPARKMSSLTTRLERVLQRNDVLVNSTGQGTLGRTARWIHALEATVDSHITIVRFNDRLADPVCAGFALLRLESQIESLAEGSTGQTELRRDLLGALEIELPSRQKQDLVSPVLDALDSLVLGLARESETLAATRDEFLPQLMSGKLRVSEAEKAMEKVV